MTIEDLERDLDDDQLAAVTAPPGNMLCIANRLRQNPCADLPDRAYD